MAINTELIDEKGRTVRPVLFNTAKDGSGTWYFALLDSDGHLQVDVVAALPAGTNAIGKLTANSGVDIGDVDVISIIPGTGATNLGKAEDAVHASGDTGVMALAVRQDTQADFGADGDYVPLSVDADGAVRVTGGGGGTQYAVDAALGATPTGTAAIAKRDDSLSALTPVEGDAVELRVDANGALWTRDDVLEAAIAGSEIQVDVVAALPTGTNALGRVGHDTTGLGHGVKTVTTVGTDEALAASTPCKWVVIQNQTDNTSKVAVGGSGVDATVATGNGLLLDPGDWTPVLSIDNLADVFVDALVAGEGVRYLYGS